MRKIVFSEDTLKSLVSEIGLSEEIVGPSDNSMEPVDRTELQGSSIRFNKDKIAWTTDRGSYFNCIRLDDHSFIRSKIKIDESRYE